MINDDQQLTKYDHIKWFPNSCLHTQTVTAVADANKWIPHNPHPCMEFVS